ncbi:uncharacterized protein N0V96_007930 [Colletotrichum fioriniae]|uniref:uncharacterized protein n=1 Tax=Colletotrichum fioriniae TaxID=710243 RepID=UPI0032DAB37D|nr:hypothetical protein N0V96_007930 [Colletotrichum fioriniae]
MKVTDAAINASDEACCTCAKLLSSVPRYSAATEKPLPDDRRLECCAHIHSALSAAPEPQRPAVIHLLPANPPPLLRRPGGPCPPPYTYTSPDAGAEDLNEKSSGSSSSSSTATPPEDTLHFLNHDTDTIASLSLRYGVPAGVLRRSNNITSDHLLHGRRTVLIPGAYYAAGVSLSPRPVEGEEEELRKSRIRRFMTGCKVSDYDVAVLYLEQVGYDLAAAMEAYADDEAWEKSHPVQDGGGGGGRGKNKAKAAPRNRGPFWRGSA